MLGAESAVPICVLKALKLSCGALLGCLVMVEKPLWRYSVVVITWDSDHIIPKTQVRALVAPQRFSFSSRLIIRHYCVAKLN